MWESLATSRRSDRVLHGAAKLLNVVVGVIALPCGCWVRGSGTPSAVCSPGSTRAGAASVAQSRERSMEP